MKIPWFLFLTSLVSLAIQNISIGQNTFVSPEVHIGYTVGATINLGLSVDFGIEYNAILNQRVGGSFGYNITRVNKGFHRQTSINLLVENKFVALKFGPARMRNNWGYSKINRCIIYGFSSDLSFKYPNTYSPMIGYKNFLYRKRDWAWFHMNYHTMYIGLDYNTIYSK